MNQRFPLADIEHLHVLGRTPARCDPLPLFLMEAARRDWLANR